MNWNATEANNEDSLVGVIVGVEDGLPLVQWPTLNGVEVWANTDLEPAWSD